MYLCPLLQNDASFFFFFTNRNLCFKCHWWGNTSTSSEAFFPPPRHTEWPVFHRSNHLFLEHFNLQSVEAVICSLWGHGKKLLIAQPEGIFVLDLGSWGTQDAVQKTFYLHIIYTYIQCLVKPSSHQEVSHQEEACLMVMLSTCRPDSAGWRRQGRAGWGWGGCFITCQELHNFRRSCFIDV